MIYPDLKNACPSWLRTCVLSHEKGKSLWQRLLKFLCMLLLHFWGLDILVVHRTTGSVADPEGGAGLQFKQKKLPYFDQIG